ncbi:MAG: peroxide stress protein YaaA [Butyricicoccaceae bacterium]
MLSIILSPAKRFRAADFSPVPCTAPRFEDRALVLRDWLRSLPYDRVKALWGVSDKLGQAAWTDLHADWTPGRQGAAVLSYDGIQYKYMTPDVFSDRANAYIDRHLRILSGLYGLLRPFDRVAPYRLEMGARIDLAGCRSLYAYWGSALADALEGDCIVNLASAEYSRAVLPHLQGRPHVTCVFAEQQGGRLIEKGVYVKMARGRMVSFLAEQQIEDPMDMRFFDDPGFAYHPELSDSSRLVFVKKTADRRPTFEF